LRQTVYVIFYFGDMRYWKLLIIFWWPIRTHKTDDWNDGCQK